MKKIISVVLTVVMMLSCFAFVPVSAAEVNVDITSVESVFGFIGDSLSEDAKERIESYYYITAEYLKTDSGIDTLISIVDEEVALPDELAGIDFSANKEEIKFVLNLIKALPDRVVEDTIENFEEIRQNTEDNNGVEEEYITAQDEINEFFSLLVSDEGIEKLAYHNVGPNAIVSLFEAFDGYVMLTDNEEGGEDFALKKIYSGYDDSVFDYIDKFNGEEVNSLEEIFNLIIETANEHYDAEQKASIKKVFGEVGIYTPMVYENDSDSGSSSNSGSGSTFFPGIIIRPIASPAPEEEEVLEEVSGGLEIPVPAEKEALFTDIVNHWSKDYVSTLAEDNVFKGYDTGNFEPDWGITREELAVVLVRVLKLESKLGTAALTTYYDVAEIAEWARESVALTTKLGIYEGYDDGFYRPKKIITREELCAIIIRAMENSGNKVVLNYTDRASFPDWSTPYIGKATYHGIVSGYPDGTFRPRQDVTRSEAAKMIYNFMQVIY